MKRGSKTLATVVIAFAAGVGAISTHLRSWTATSYGARAHATHATYPTHATHSWRLPIDGIDLESLKGGFDERREGHRHEAVDILAPRNTPVHAVADGTIAKLFVSTAGGNTIYQFDSTQRYCYYYAHLQRYAEGLADGTVVRQGEIVGYVGTSGNAPADTPHLHFGIFELGPDKRWWEGTPIDPYRYFKSREP